MAEGLTVINAAQPDVTVQSDAIIQVAFKVACDNPPMTIDTEHR
jgi:hypothetical protein